MYLPHSKCSVRVIEFADLISYPNYRSPVTTGTSVLGLIFDGGVMLAGDMLGSYGSMAKFRSIERIIKVNNSTVLGATGDIADFQHLQSIIEQKV